MVSNRRNEKSPKIAPKITTKAKKSDLERRTSAALRAAGLELVGWAGALPRRAGGRGAAAIRARAREREGNGRVESRDGERERERRAADIFG